MVIIKNIPGLLAIVPAQTTGWRGRFECNYYRTNSKGNHIILGKPLEID